MISKGSIVALNAVEDNQAFINRHIVGEVINVCDGNLLIEKFGGSREIITVKKWLFALCTGNLWMKIHSSRLIIMFSKTVVINTGLLLFGAPTRWQKFSAWLNKSKYKPFYGVSGAQYWVLKKKLCGKVFADGFFIPFGYQWIKRPLYFTLFDKKLSWNQNQKN